MKKTVRLCVGFCISICILFIAQIVNAQTYTDENGNVFTYSVNSPVYGGATITDFQGGGDVIIPDEMGGSPVIAIYLRAFEDCPNLKTIVIPASVKGIGLYAFNNCINLEEVKLYNGITSIGDFAFNNCSSLKKINIPTGITKIGNNTFSQCINLTEITFPEGVTTIGLQAFYECRNLTDITLPLSLTSIDNAALYLCDSLSNITYMGSATDWEKISVGTANTALESASVRFVADECNHIFTQWQMTIEPTCLEDGYRKKHCTVCSYYTGESVSKLGHDTSNEIWQIKSNPNCYLNGVEELICERCFKVAKSRTIPATNEHNYEYYVIEPTCTENGYTEYYCTQRGCTASYVEDYTQPKGHQMGNWMVYYEPTCTSKGYEERWCIDCGYSEHRYPDPIGHDVSGAWWEMIHWPGCESEGEEGLHCNRCGYVAETRPIPPRGHIYESYEIYPTCTEGGYTRYVCWDCSDSYLANFVDATGHSYGYWETVSDPTCTQAGIKRKYCYNFDYNYGECGHYLEETIEETGHNFGEWETTINLNCSQDGVKSRFCYNCYTEETETISALGHDYENDWIITEYPTCGSAGGKILRCGICDEFLQYETIPQTNEHNYEVFERPATCLYGGYTQYTCESCYHSYKDSFTDALGHSFSEWEVYEYENCIKNGVEKRYCQNIDLHTNLQCEEYETREILKTEHRISDWVLEVPPTCTEDGYYRKRCLNYDKYNDIPCDYYEEKVAYRTGHSYGEWEVISEPTCTEEGYRTKLCSDCKNVMEHYTLPLGHDTDNLNWVVVYEPTCTKKGLVKALCPRCQLEMGYHKQIDMIEHNYTIVVYDPTCTEKGYTHYYCNMCKGEFNIDYISALGHNFGSWETIEEAQKGKPGSEERVCSGCGLKESRPSYIVTLSFVANGGTGVPESFTGISNSVVTLPEIQPERTGYSFTYWMYYVDEYTWGYVLPGKEIVLPSQDTIFYAQWTKVYDVIISYYSACGDSLYWAILGDGTLNIVGSGDMYDWDTEANKAPWTNSANKITRLKLTGEITSIGENAFLGCDLIKEVIYGNTRAKWLSLTSDGNYGLREDAVVYCTDETNIIELEATLSNNGVWVNATATNIPSDAKLYVSAYIGDNCVSVKEVKAENGAGTVNFEENAITKVKAFLWKSNLTPGCAHRENEIKQ